jgi:hypothetical protein
MLRLSDGIAKSPNTFNFMTTITTPTDMVKQGGLLRELALDAKVSHASGHYTATHTAYHVEAQFIELAQAIQIVQVPDTTITNLPLLIEIGDETDLVPTDLFGAFHVPEGEEDPVQITWAEWMRSNYTVIERGGKQYINASAHTGNNPELTTLEPVYASLIKPSDLPTEES